MPKKKDCGGLLLFHKFPEKLRRLRPRQQQIRPPDSLLRVVERTREDFRGLCRAHVRARQEQIRRHSKRRHTFRHLFGLLDAFLGQISFRVGRALRILAVNGDPVPHDVELHNSLAMNG